MFLKAKLEGGILTAFTCKLCTEHMSIIPQNGGCHPSNHPQAMFPPTRYSSFQLATAMTNVDLYCVWS